MGIVCIVEQSFLISLKTKQETGIVVLGATKKMLSEKRSSSIFKAQMHFYWDTHLHCYTSNKLRFLQFQCIEDNGLQLRKKNFGVIDCRYESGAREKQQKRPRSLIIFVSVFILLSNPLLRKHQSNNSNNHQSPKQTFPTQTIVAGNDRIYSKRACRWL